MSDRFSRTLLAGLHISHLLTLCFVIFYIFITYHLYFHSDAAVINLLAQEAFDTRQLFPDSWYFVNKDIYATTFGYVFIVPLLLFFENSFCLHAIADLVSLLIFAIVLHFFIASLELDRHFSLLGKILVLSSLSIVKAEDLFGQQSYLWATMDALIVLTAINHMLTGKKSYFSVLFFAVALLHASIANPLRGVFFFVLPLVLSLGISHFFKIEAHAFKTKRFIVILTLALFALAYGINSVIAANLNIVEVSSQLNVASFKRVLINGYLFCSGLLSYYGVITLGESGYPKFNGCFAVINFIFFLLTLYSIFYFRKRMISLPFAQSFALLFGAIAFVMVLGMYIFAFPLAVDQWTMRYFTIPFTILGFSLIFFMQQMINAPLKSVSVFLLLSVLLANSYKNYVSPAFSETYAIKENPKAHLTKFLVDSKISKGYASFWNAQVVSVLSNAHILVAPIDLALKKPFTWLSSSRWFHPQNMKSALILSRDEYARFGQELFASCTGQPAEHHAIDGFHVLLYNSDLANCFEN